MNKLELIIGPVASGKSLRLIEKINRYKIAGRKVLIIKPDIDTRSTNVKSRFTNKEIDCTILPQTIPLNLPFNIKDYDIIAIEESQFFNRLYDFCINLLLNNKEVEVIVSGLDTDFRGEPFGEIPKLITLASSITKLTAICMKCKNDNAIFSQKLKKNDNQIEIGDLETYIPVCINCFIPGGSNEF